MGSSKENEIPEFASNAATGRLYLFYQRQVGLLVALFERLWTVEGNERVSSMQPFLYALVKSAEAISLLSGHYYLRDAYMLARSLLESAVNYMYLLVCDDEGYFAMEAHARQKGFRMLNRTIQSGGLTVGISGPEINPLDMPGLQEALDKFTGAKGGVKTRWTESSLAERVVLIGDKVADFKPFLLLLSLLAIYDNASEALHGTLYGATFWLGGFTFRPVSSDEASTTRMINEHFSEIFLLSGLVLGQLIRVVSTLAPIADIHNRSEENYSEIDEFMTLQAAAEDMANVPPSPTESAEGPDD